MPALTIMLTLENKFYKVSHLNNVQISANNDLVTFISGLLLGNDQQARSWFSLFIRQKVSLLMFINVKYILLRDDVYNRR